MKAGEEATAFMRWIVERSAEDDSGALQIMYGIEGRHELTEETLGHLEGLECGDPLMGLLLLTHGHPRIGGDDSSPLGSRERFAYRRLRTSCRIRRSAVTNSGS